MKQPGSILLLLFFATNLCVYAQDSEKVLTETLTNISGKTGGKITRSEILDDGMIHMNEGRGPELRISSFMLTIVNTKEMLEFKNNTDGKLTDAMRTSILEAPLKSKIYVEYIMAASDGSSNRSLPPMSFILSD
jgi:hypothetical protein